VVNSRIAPDARTPNPRSVADDSNAQPASARRVYDFYGDSRDRDDTDDAADSDAANPPVRVERPGSAYQTKATRVRVIGQRQQLAVPDRRLQSAPRPEPFWGSEGRNKRGDDDDSQ
jgi:hypothetical protein